MNSRSCKQKFDHEYFSAESLDLHPERMVIIGFIAADGCVSQNRGQPLLAFNLCKADKCVLNVINAEIAGGSRRIYPNVKTRSVMMNFPSRKMCDDLARFGIVPRKTRTMRFPRLSTDETRLFLRGYFYGDGCVHSHTYSFVGTSEFICGAKEFLEPHVVQHAGCTQLKNGYAAMQLSSIHGLNFSKFLFEDDRMVLLPRKHIVSSWSATPRRLSILKTLALKRIPV